MLKEWGTVAGEAKSGPEVTGLRKKGLSLTRACGENVSIWGSSV